MCPYFCGKELCLKLMQRFNTCCITSAIIFNHSNRNIIVRKGEKRSCPRNDEEICHLVYRRRSCLLRLQPGSCVIVNLFKMKIVSLHNLLIVFLLFVSAKRIRQYLELSCQYVFTQSQVSFNKSIPLIFSVVRYFSIRHMNCQSQLSH